MITHALYFLILTGTAVLFSWLLTALLVKALPEGMLLDHPNERSNHATPTPRGGGIAVIGVLIAFLLVSSAPGALAFALLLLAAVSLLDDHKALAAKWRLMAQAAAVLVGVTLLEGQVFQGLLPPWLDRVLVMVAWMWMINLYNFMDGIDGIASAETIALGLGMVVLSLAVGTLPRSLLIDGGLMAASIAGFAWWNRHPARIFLGDVGSVPLGFMAGFLLLQLAASGLWASALILPAYYLLDATLTLVHRLARGQIIWHAHSEHAYQRAVRAGRSHGDVVRLISLLNLCLLGLALLAALVPASQWVALVAAYAAAFGLAGWFSAMRPARA